MKQRLLSTLLALCLVLSLLPGAALAAEPEPPAAAAVSAAAAPAASARSLDAQSVYQAMIALKSRYPEGTPWTNDNYYGWRGGIYSGGYGCAGFAFMLSDAAFGTLPARMVRQINYPDVRVGDILRVNGDTHSVIILEVQSDGAVIAEGNYNRSIHWGRKLSRSEVLAADYVLTRYPAEGAAARYTVYFDGSGGTVPYTSKTVTQGQTYGSLPTPSRSGYTFAGWYTSGGSRVYESTTVNLTGSQTLYARWTQTPTAATYTVYFNGNGGTVPYTSKTVTQGQTYGSLPTPRLSGYTFTGWYTSYSGGSRVYESTTVNLTGNQTLYAQWKQETSTSAYWTDVASSADGAALVRGAANKTLTKDLVLIYYSSGCGYSQTYVPQFKALAESQRIPMQGYEHFANGQLSALWSYGFASGSIGWPCVLTYNAATKTAKFTHSVRSMSAFQAALSDNGIGSGSVAPSRYTVYFNGNGGTVPYTSKTVTRGSTYGSLPTPSRSGYTFAGWYTSYSGGSRIYESTTVNLTGNQTLYARWTENVTSYTVYFNGNGGTVPYSSKTVTRGSTYGSLPTPTRSGYTFAGWYTSYSGGSRIYAGTTVNLTGSQTLYAHWTKNSTAATYTVYFNGNGGTVPYRSKTVTRGQTYGTLPTPTRSGYTFAGWYTSSSSGSRIYASTTVNLTGSQTLYAHWKQNTSSNAYWTELTSRSAAGTYVRDASRKTLTKNLVLINYRSGSSYSQTLLPQFKALAQREGIPMYGYDDKADGDLQSFWTYGFVANNVDIGYLAVLTYNASTRTAKFSHYVRSLSAFQKALSDNGIGASSTYTVTFNGNGGTVPYRSKTVTRGSAYGTLPTPTRKGYTFAGWYTASSGGSRVYASTTFNRSSSQTLYAHWTANASYRVTFNANGGTVSPASKMVTKGTTYGTLPTPTRKGYTFSGWYTASSGGSRVYASTTFNRSGSQTLYAHWKQNASYRVTFNANGGTVSPTSKMVTKGAAYGTLPTPTRSGYTFAGWYTASSGGSRVYASTTFNRSGSQTLYARWTASSSKSGYVTVPANTRLPLYSTATTANSSNYLAARSSSYRIYYTNKVSLTNGATRYYATFSGGKSFWFTPPSTTYGSWRITIPAYYKMPLYSSSTSTSPVGYGTAKSTAYTIPASYRAIRSDSTVRYYTTASASGKGYWIDWTSGMTVR